MAGLEVVVRPFSSPQTGPSPIHQPGAIDVPPVRLVVGLVGGDKTFGFSSSFTLSSYMAAVHTEAPSTAFDMTTGKLSG